MSIPRRRAAFCASLSLPLLFAAGCSGNRAVMPDADAIAADSGAITLAAGNWQISSSAPAAARLPVFSGEFTNRSGTISGILHSQSETACVSPATSFTLTGSTSSKNLVTLTGRVAGGALTVTGTLAENGKSLTAATYSITGGACALPAKVQAVAQAFAPITGTYSGNFADIDGQIAQVTADFSQSTTPDPEGNFTLAGTATVSNNPCFPSTIPISKTQVTGGTFTFTYAADDNSVTANGTFNSEATVLTINSWTSSGSCGADTGVSSTMTKQ